MFKFKDITNGEVLTFTAVVGRMISGIIFAVMLGAVYYLIQGHILNGIIPHMSYVDCLATIYGLKIVSYPLRRN